VGAIVEVSLERILENILAIPDIPEVESHKLSELCRILAALEGLFVEDFSEVCLLCFVKVVNSSLPSHLLWCHTFRLG
jgi:centromere/kinetochore protein ZW10